MEALFQPYAAGAAATALAPLGKSKTFPGFIIHLSQVSYESPEFFLVADGLLWVKSAFQVLHEVYCSRAKLVHKTILVGSVQDVGTQRSTKFW